MLYLASVTETVGGLAHFLLRLLLQGFFLFCTLLFNACFKSSSSVVWVKVWQKACMKEGIILLTHEDLKIPCCTDESFPTITLPDPNAFLVGWLEKMFIKRAQLTWQVPSFHANENSRENRHIITRLFWCLNVTTVDIK